MSLELEGALGGDVIQMRKLSRMILFCFVFNLRSQNGEKHQFLMSLLNWRQVYHGLTTDEGWKNAPVTQILSTWAMLLFQALISVLKTQEFRIYDKLGCVLMEQLPFYVLGSWQRDWGENRVASTEIGWGEKMGFSRNYDHPCSLRNVNPETHTQRS